MTILNAQHFMSMQNSNEQKNNLQRTEDIFFSWWRDFFFEKKSIACCVFSTNIRFFVCGPEFFVRGIEDFCLFDCVTFKCVWAKNAYLDFNS